MKQELAELEKIVNVRFNQKGDSMKWFIIPALALGLAAILFLTLRKGNKEAKLYRVRRLSDWEVELSELPAKIAEQLQNKN